MRFSPRTFVPFLLGFAGLLFLLTAVRPALYEATFDRTSFVLGIVFTILGLAVRGGIRRAAATATDRSR